MFMLETLTVSQKSEKYQAIIKHQYLRQLFLVGGRGNGGGGGGGGGLVPNYWFAIQKTSNFSSCFEPRVGGGGGGDGVSDFLNLLFWPICLP